MAQADSFTMMALGDYRFSLDTAAYQELERSSAWTWNAVDRIGARPAMQYTGPGEETVRLPGVIFPHYRGGLGQIDAMRVEADKGEALMLVSGTGQVWGMFVIDAIRETHTVFFTNGAPRRIDFEVSLINYGESR